jgi:hypothetical protein
MVVAAYMPVDSVAEPMLSIMERCVYGQRLVSRGYQVEPVDEFDSGWLDIRGLARSDNVSQEGRAVVRLVDILRARGVRSHEIIVVVPTHRGRGEVKKMLLGLPGVSVGGLDCIPKGSSEYVILVLGGESSQWGDWAIRTGSLIALPASRARRGLFVIGDRSYWSRQPLMEAASELLRSLSVDIVVAGTEQREESGACHCGEEGHGTFGTVKKSCAEDTGCRVMTAQMPSWVADRA